MDYIFEHWYIIPIFVVLIALTVFAWIKAIASGQKRKAERERIIAALEKEKALRNDFKVLSPSTFSDESISDERLLFGVAMNIQMSIEKAENMSEEYLALNEVKRKVYALNFVFEDSKYETLSDFFRANGEPLLSQAQVAVNDVFGGKFTEIFNSQFAMFDDDSEVSFDEEKLISLDAEFKALMDSEKDAVLSKISQYIKSNKEQLI